MNDPASSAGASVRATKPAAPHCPETPSSRLLPSLAYSPLQIFVWAVIPLGLLLWCNWGSYQTISGDIDAGQQQRWILSLWGGGLLAFGYAIVATVMWFRRSTVNGAMAVAAFVPLVAFINYAVWRLPGTVPRAAEWIISSESIVIQNLTGVMPAILYFGAVICGGRGRSAGQEMGKALLGLLAVGALVGVCAAFGSEGFEITAIVCMTLAILVCTLAVLRLLILVGNAMFRLSPLAVVLIGLWVGLLLPVIGLWVNSFVPFPYDFQVPWVYAMAVVNGVLLSVPLPSSVGPRRVVWFAQCVGFPFSLYFFIVFMPFLPLSVPGLMVWGGGLLVLVPACVLILHGFRVVDGFRKFRVTNQGQGNAMVQWGMVAAAFALMPGVLWWNASADRRVLHQALDFVYTASPHNSPRFGGEPDALRRTLSHVQEFKAGKKLPLLSTLYNETVFKGLTLPDSKIKQLSQTFLGEEIAFKKNKSMWGGGRGFANQNFRIGNPPHTDVSLLPVTASYLAEGDGFVRTTAMLNMENNQAQQGEFTTSLTLPENAAVSGFWLHIENERVPGRMTEKKASMWVYQMIRDVTRRDPGILRYTSPDQLELRVFPLAGHEVRTVEIEFLAPVSVAKPVIVGGQRISLTDGSSQADAGVCFAASSTGASVAVAARSFSESLPSFNREPYLHFIIDWSAVSAVSPAMIEQAIETASSSVPGARLGSASLVNFEMHEASQKPQPLETLAVTLADASARIPKRGGFVPGRAMHSVLVNRHKQFESAQPGDPAFDRFPVFMIIGSENAIDLQGDELPWVAQMLPDSPDYYVMDSAKSEWAAVGFEEGAVSGGLLHSVHVFHVAGRNLVARAKEADIAHAHGGLDRSSVPSLTVFNRESGQFIPVAALHLTEDQAYAQALALWRYQELSIADPSAVGSDSLREIVLKSRDTGILTNATAYIAVESHAQWKMLEEAEKKKLKAGKVFELGEAPPISSVPEPSTGLLVLIAGIALVFQRRRPR